MKYQVNRTLVRNWKTNIGQVVNVTKHLMHMWNNWGISTLLAREQLLAHVNTIMSLATLVPRFEVLDHVLSYHFVKLHLQLSTHGG